MHNSDSESEVSNQKSSTIMFNWSELKLDSATYNVAQVFIGESTDQEIAQNSTEQDLSNCESITQINAVDSVLVLRRRQEKAKRKKKKKKRKGKINKQKQWEQYVLKYTSHGSKDQKNKPKHNCKEKVGNFTSNATQTSFIWSTESAKDSIEFENQKSDSSGLSELIYPSLADLLKTQMLLNLHNNLSSGQSSSINSICMNCFERSLNTGSHSNPANNKSCIRNSRKQMSKRKRRISKNSSLKKKKRKVTYYHSHQLSSEDIRLDPQSSSSTILAE